ncbi:MAG: amidohydrolase, partial [Janthinobacterium sp.]|nr:amidohydrolase [Janthinobacterium sp.]
MPTLPLRRTLLMLACLGALGHAHADTVIDNANGYTLDANGKVLRFTALAFDDGGKLLAVGSAAQVKRRAARGALHVDVQ